MEILTATVVNLLTQAPIILVWLVGFVLAFVFWQKHPAVSRLIIIALSGFLILTVINAFLNIWLPPFLMRERGMNAQQFSIILTIKGIVSSILMAGLWGLLIAAVFGWREKRETTSKL